MKIKSLEINNFRGIKHLRLDFHKQTNILVGVNGSGKSSILDCLAIMFSSFLEQDSRFYFNGYVGYPFSDQDITNGMSKSQNEIEIVLRNEPIKLRIERTRRDIKHARINSDYNGTARECNLDLQALLSEYFPLIIYYPVNRAVFDITLETSKMDLHDQIWAYDHAIADDRKSFQIFFEWFRAREDLENEKRLEETQYRDSQLQAVRDAIENFIPYFSGLRVKRAPLRMVVYKDREELIIDQLSDGEKCMLAMVGDLARRLAIANPSLDDPLQGEGVVMIDEVDLHLHPGWQRMIVPGLERTFPNCQFVLATHSPQILSHAKPECIWLLQRSKKEFTAVHPEDAYGLDSNRILEDIMGVPERPSEIKEQLKRLFLAIDQGNLESAQSDLQKLREDIGSDPELAKADVLIRRKEILNR